MIVNPLKMNNKYKCNKHVMKYLVYRCKLPILAIDGDSFYFTDNDILRECLKRMPLKIILLSFL